MISERVTIQEIVFEECFALLNSCKKETKKGAIHDEEAVSIREYI